MSYPRYDGGVEMPSQITFIVIHVEAPQLVEHLGSFAALDTAKDRANAHFFDRHQSPKLRWHDDPWGGSRARYLNTEYLVRELEWVSDPPTVLSDERLTGSN